MCDLCGALAVHGGHLANHQWGGLVLNADDDKWHPVAPLSFLSVQSTVVAKQSPEGRPQRPKGLGYKFATSSSRQRPRLVRSTRSLGLQPVDLCSPIWPGAFVKATTAGQA